MNACVYSFFHRELAPMAQDVVDLLTSCRAWVDPNLIALVPGSGEASLSKRKKRKRSKKKPDETGKINAVLTDEENEFEILDTNRIVLKRAEHVKDESDDEESS